LKTESSGDYCNQLVLVVKVYINATTS